MMHLLLLWTTRRKTNQNVVRFLFGISLEPHYRRRSEQPLLDPDVTPHCQEELETRIMMQEQLYDTYQKSLSLSKN